MHVCVAIVGFRNPGDITSCLRALARSTHPDFEVVICENGGKAAYEALTAAIPKTLAGGQTVRAVLAAKNLGYAGGVNVCLNASKDADAWWVLNPDTEPYPEAMAALVTRLAHGDREAVGCTILLPNGKVQSHGGRWQAWLARAVSLGIGEAADIRPNPASVERRQNYLNGASMMIGRRFLEATGPMREDYFLYCEEVEWCLRGLKRGMRLGFEPKALLLHHLGTTTGNLSNATQRARMPTFLNERNRLLLTRDCYPLRLAIVALTSFMMIFAKYGRRGAWRQVGYGLAGWWAGLNNARGAPRWADVEGGPRL